MRLEGVVLGRDLVVVEATDEGNLLQDVGLDARNAVEEEDGEDAGGSTEGGADGAPVLEVWLDRCSYWVCVYAFVAMGIVGLHPEEGAGGVLAELGLGDGVAVAPLESAFCASMSVWHRNSGFCERIPRAVLALE